MHAKGLSAGTVAVRDDGGVPFRNAILNDTLEGIGKGIGECVAVADKEEIWISRIKGNATAAAALGLYQCRYKQEQHLSSKGGSGNTSNQVLVQ